MKRRIVVLLLTALAVAVTAAWAGSEAGHGAMTEGMDLKQYDIRFNRLDIDDSGTLSWDEYNAHFADKDRKIFDALDADGSGAIEQKEWHDFKAAHGMAGPREGGKGRYHQGDLPDPAPYMVHMGDIDQDGDDALSWKEFQARFPDSEKSVFVAIDLDQDGSISHDEWHAFKTAHGKGEGYHHSDG